MDFLTAAFINDLANYEAEIKMETIRSHASGSWRLIRDVEQEATGYTGPTTYTASNNVPRTAIPLGRVNPGGRLNGSYWSSGEKRHCACYR